jgi:hypothetical protein
MENTKLQEIWQLLSQKEQSDLSDWLAFDTVRDDVRGLYRLCCRMGVTGKWLPKTIVFEVLYGNTEYDDARLRRAQSFLVKCIERFLVFRSLSNDEGLMQQHLANEYRQRKHEKGFLQTFKTWQAQLKIAPLHAETLHRQAQAEQTWQAYQLPSQPQENNLQALLTAEARAFAARHLRTVCIAISYQNIYKRDYDLGILTELLPHIAAQNWHETTPAIGAYYYLYYMITSENGLPFFSVLVGKLPEYQGVFEAEEYKYLYVGVLNFAIQEVNKYGINKHGRTFVQQLFGLYQNGVQQGYLLDKGYLSPVTYKNIVAIGLWLGETDYVRSFLEDYRTALPAADRKAYYEYNLARYYFTIKDYKNAMPLINQMTTTQHFLLLDSKLMLLKMYFELKEYDVLDAHLRNFAQFLHRKRSVLSYHQANYKNIIAFTKQLMLLETLKKQEIDALRETISSTNPLTEREWLLGRFL